MVSSTVEGVHHDLKRSKIKTEKELYHHHHHHHHQGEITLHFSEILISVLVSTVESFSASIIMLKASMYLLTEDIRPHDKTGLRGGL